MKLALFFDEFNKYSLSWWDGIKQSVETDKIMKKKWNYIQVESILKRQCLNIIAYYFYGIKSEIYSRILNSVNQCPTI